MALVSEAEAAAPLDARTPSVEMAVAEEERWADAGERLRSAHLSERFLELKERELQNVIAQNYARIQGVEKELQGLQLQLKLTSGPKRSALEMMRRKIEVQAERVIAARTDAVAAQKAADVAAERLKAEERAKEQLCQELNLLVQQSAHAQLEKLETLTRRLEALNAPAASGPGGTAELQQRIAEVAAGEAAAASAADSVVASHAFADSTAVSSAAAAADPQQADIGAQRAAAAAKAGQQAAAARARHLGVGAPRRHGSPAPGRGPTQEITATGGRPAARVPRQAAAATTGQAGAFQGFDT